MQLSKRKRLKLKASCKVNFKFFAHLALRILPKVGLPIKFELNEAQQYFHKRLIEQKKRTGRVRIVVLKGRQQGLTTYCSGRFFYFCMFFAGTRVFIISHESKTTNAMFEMVRRYYEFCPKWLRADKAKDSSGGGMDFPSMLSSYRLGTANNPNNGRGFTADKFHGSEVAFWAFASEILAGVLQAIPREKGTEVIFESTANGVGGEFYNFVMDAKEDPESEFELVFIPWYWQSEYQEEPPFNFVRNDEEKAIAKLIKNHPDGDEFNYTISDAQLFWRRLKIKELKSEDKFKQEYPLTVEEAFISSGRPVFNALKLRNALDRCSQPKYIYKVLGEGELKLVDPKTEFVPDDYDRKGQLLHKAVSGYLLVWDEPSDTYSYAMGGDVAEGLETGDESSCDVSNDLGVQVAHYHGTISPSEYGYLLNAVGRKYNDAFLGVELNNHGHAVVQRLLDLNYPNLYIQTDFGKTVTKENRRYGWITTSASKPRIIDNLNTLVDQDSTGIQCIYTIKQCQTYEKDKKGATNAKEGELDDCVMSYAITQEMVRLMPRGNASDVGYGDIRGR